MKETEGSKMAPRKAAARPFDVVVLGATGFTGRLAVEYLSSHYASPSSSSAVRWLATARSSSKLEALRKELYLDPSRVALCDVGDEESLNSVVKQAGCIANFAGSPFVDKAIPVVVACAKHGTHYIDITGETPLQRATYDLHHDDARATCALIVHQCGYDSIPSDLGAFLAVAALRERHGCDAATLKTFAGKTKGGASGGTLHTALTLLTSSKKQIPGAAAAAARGSYALDPEGARGGPDTNDYGSVIGWDARAATWHMPFVMAAANAPVVRKSAALLGYGERVRYSEVQAVPSLLGAVGGLFGLLLGGLALLTPPIRWLLFLARVLPRPGEGPGKKLRETGHFHMFTYAVGPAGEAARADIRSGAAGDPGYKATALMAVESALCLALERGRCASEGGVLTPASAMGEVLVERLRAAGMVLESRAL